MPDYTVTIERQITHEYTVECTAADPKAAGAVAMDIVLKGNDDELDHRYYDGMLEVTEVQEVEYEDEEAAD